MSDRAKSELKHSDRLVSLDAYRGLVMFVLAASGFGIAKTAGNLPDNDLLQYLKFHTTHPEWNSQLSLFGFSLWDMIQPAFMFMVGVSLPYSNAKRAERGDSFALRLRHALWRVLLLVLLGVFLQSQRKPETNWIFTNVLSQIGLGYAFLFLLAGKSFRLQATVGAVVLAGYWIAMVVLPTDAVNYAAHFENGTSFPQQFDVWLLNQFPRTNPFEAHAYATLNFVPSIVTMLLGLMSGQLLQDDKLSSGTKVTRLLLGGLACLAVGVLWRFLGCPIVNKLWTPSWTLFSGAYVIWFLAAMYWLVDVKGWKRWTFPLVVVGLNPITMYFMSMTTRRWVSDSLKTHLPNGWFAGDFGPVVQSCLIVGIFWMILYWMYRNRIFVRI